MSYNLTNEKTYLEWDLKGEKVYGMLLPIPEKLNGSYRFNHGQSVKKYLKVEFWQDGLLRMDQVTDVRFEVQRVVYDFTQHFIGSFQLPVDSILLETDYEIPDNMELYVEFIEGDGVPVFGDGDVTTS